MLEKRSDECVSSRIYVAAVLCVYLRVRVFVCQPACTHTCVHMHAARGHLSVCFCYLPV